MNNLLQIKVPIKSLVSLCYLLIEQDGDSEAFSFHRLLGQVWWIIRAQNAAKSTVRTFIRFPLMQQTMGEFDGFIWWPRAVQLIIDALKKPSESKHASKVADISTFVRGSFVQVYCMPQVTRYQIGLWWLKGLKSAIHVLIHWHRLWWLKGLKSAIHVMIHWHPSTLINLEQKIGVGCMKFLEFSISYPHFTYRTPLNLPKNKGGGFN